MSSGVSAAIEDWGFCQAKDKNAQGFRYDDNGK
jgi:hypothetical protein